MARKWCVKGSCATSYMNSSGDSMRQECRLSQISQISQIILSYLSCSMLCSWCSWWASRCSWWTKWMQSMDKKLDHLAHAGGASYAQSCCKTQSEHGSMQDKQLQGHGAKELALDQPIEDTKTLLVWDKGDGSWRMVTRVGAMITPQWMRD